MTRLGAIGPALLALMGCAIAAFGNPSIGTGAAVVFSAITLLMIAAAPSRDCTPGDLRDYLLILAGTLLVYLSNNLALMLAGWVLCIVPVWKPAGTMARIHLAASALCLAACIGMLARHGLTVSELPVVEDVTAFALLVLAVLLRKGVFPFHLWMPKSAETGPLLKLSLVFNGHLGAFLVLQLGARLMPRTAESAYTPLSDIALVGAVVASIMTLVERNPRRMVALLAISQASFIFAGLESATVPGQTGAMLYACAVMIATTAVFLVLRLLEVRAGVTLLLDRYHGYAAHAPRLAAFFAVSGLALVGLPGTLGFPAGDLLLQGTLQSHPWVGLLMPAATALNAVSFYRLFARLFLGKAGRRVTHIADALPRERFALSAAVMAIVLFGFAPGLLISSQPADEKKVAQVVLHGVSVGSPVGAHDQGPQHVRAGVGNSDRAQHLAPAGR